MHAYGRCYISVLAWPERMDEFARVVAIKDAFSLDDYTSRELARRQAPTILRRVDEGQCERCAARLREAGIEVDVVALRDIVSRAMPPRALAMSIRGGNTPSLEFQIAHDASRSVDCGKVTLFVRGSVQSPVGHGEPDTSVAVGHMLHGSTSARDWDQGHAARSRRKVIDLLDIHDSDGGCVRIEAQRFNFASLGLARAATPQSNLSTLVDALRSHCPNAHLDEKFASARFVATFVGDLGGYACGKGGSSVPPADSKCLAAFQFYSAWLELLRENP